MSTYLVLHKLNVCIYFMEKKEWESRGQIKEKEINAGTKSHIEQKIIARS